MQDLYRAELQGAHCVEIEFQEITACQATLSKQLAASGPARGNRGSAAVPGAAAQGQPQRTQRAIHPALGLHSG